MKKRNSIIVSILAFALLIGGGGALLGTFCKKPDNSFTNDYEAPNKIAELYNGTSFDKTNLQKLFDTISGRTNVGFGKLRAMANTTTTSEQMRENAGDEISVTLGELEWTPTYLSTDNNGNVILSLWLTKNEQDAWKGENNGNADGLSSNQGRYYGFYQGGLYSDWSSNWSKSATKDGDPNFYPSAMYGTSYIRAVTLNNGGQYATSNTEMSTASYTPNSSSVFAKFTMPEIDGSLTKYIVKPVDVKWQENQSAKSSAGYSYNLSNDAWSTETPDDGFNSKSYNYAEHNGYDTWKDDYIWLPSMAETGSSGESDGLWKTSTKQRANYNGTTSTSAITGSVGGGSDVGFDGTGSVDYYIYPMSWLRSGNSFSASAAYRLDASGSDCNNSGVSHSLAVRPSLHLNLKDAAESAGISTIETWQDFAADKFANEDEADGVETPYEISSAEELARLAYVVNNNLSNSAGVAYNTLNYKLTADINLAGRQWAPIGTNDKSPFRGKFDGGGHTINRMTISVPDLRDDDANHDFGLFGYARSSSSTSWDVKLSNLILRRPYIRIEHYNGQLHKCYAGALVGRLLQSAGVHNVKAYDVDVSIYMSSYGGYIPEIGGLIGEANFVTDISNIYTSGRVVSCGAKFPNNQSADGFAGGLVGMLRGTLQHSETSCYVESTNYSPGGLVGKLNNGTISNCIARATLKGREQYGLASEHGATDTGAATGTIKNCYFIGESDDNQALPFAGEGVSVEYCYSVINGQKYISNDADDAGWLEGWAIVNSINGGLPIQKDMFWSASFADNSQEDFENLFADFSVSH